ncbi:hypothetical protein [Lentzea sp. NPDC059081]|uniref:hypothetical protein n=1 Tax=Lentzea sp. NPDC059081 TaxID=3346719 RepID=UPI003698B105
MYAWVWRRLPGPFALRLVVALVVLCGLGLLLWYVVFPLLDPLLPFSDSTVEALSPR